jgi:PhnB protein
VPDSVTSAVNKMSENLIEQLDQAVEAIKAQPDIHPPVSAEVEPLVRLAAELRGLPREEFRVRLKEDLIRAASETAAAVKPPVVFREGFHTITPYLAVREAPELIDFVKRAFDAQGTVHGTGSEGGLHAEYQIGDSMIMIGGGSSWTGTPKPTALHVYVDDVDAVYERALKVGATSLAKPLEDHGERVAGVRDVAGNEWYIARRLSGSHTDEGLRSVTVYLHPRGAAQMVDFLKQAFDAKEVAVYREDPGGPVVHAKIKIGDSIIEMGEAHGQWQPMPSMLYLYVEDVDAWYERALAGGAIAASEPADQPYGDRVAGVNDPFGNIWYLATPIKSAGSPTQDS